MKNKVRPIDANALAKRIREYMDNFPYAGTRLATCRVVLSMLGDEGQTPTLTDHFPDLTNMIPLTLEQLRRMECPTPVWAEVEGKTIEGWDSYWCLCHRGRVLAPGHIMMYADSVDGVAFYAYPPAHIDRDAWTAEWKDHYKSGVHAGTGAICSSCDVWNERKTHICPFCGKAMDEDGFAMLEKRMGVR